MSFRIRLNPVARPEIPQQIWDEAFAVVRDDLLKAIEKHGAFAAASMHEILGDVTEEAMAELLAAAHANDLQEFESELADVAVAAIWGIASIRCNAVGVSWSGNGETQ